MPPTTAPENPTAARGRNAASKPLVASATSSSSKPNPTTSNPRSGSISSNPSRTSSILSSKSSKDPAGSSLKKTNDSSSTKDDQASFDSGFKVTKVSSTTVTLQTTWSHTPVSEPTRPPVSATEQPQVQTSDALQIAAQVYPWTFMSSTLDACFRNAESAATKSLETRANELAAEEAEVSEKLDRLHTERSIEFFDELGSDKFVKEAPAIMQLFHSHGEACNIIELEALSLVSRDAPDPPEDDPLKVYRDMLHDLEILHDQATSLQDSISRLTEEPLGTQTDKSSEVEPTSAVTTEASSARSQVSGVFAACLPVLRARLANLSMAQELIDSALENASLSLRMESMGLMD